MVAWRTDAAFLGKYFKKGDPIAISGHLTSRVWTDKNGNKRTSIEIVANNWGIDFVPSGKKHADTTEATAAEPADDRDDEGPDVGMFDDDDEAVLPF